MHAVVMESLEEYLTGALGPATQRHIEAHLSTCHSCREEIHSMQAVSQLFVSLRSEQTWQSSPGFLAGVMEKTERRSSPSVFAGVFALDLVFGRRLVFACLLTLAVLGGLLVSRESGYPGSISAEAVMAQQNAPAFESAPAQDNMLVTLTAYEY